MRSLIAPRKQQSTLRQDSFFRAGVTEGTGMNPSTPIVIVYNDVAVTWSHANEDQERKRSWMSFIPLPTAR